MLTFGGTYVMSMFKSFVNFLALGNTATVV